VDAARADALGLIAGTGRFPLDVARSARRRFERVVALAFHRLTDPRIESEASAVTWLHPGEVGAGLAAFRSAGVQRAVMAGKVPKSALYARPASLRLDDEATRLLSRLSARGDAALLAGVAAYLESRGIELLDQTALVPELLAGAGALGRTPLPDACAADIAHAWPIATALADLDVGQTVVVRGGAVLAVEAIEGTDATIRRVGALGRGASVVKVARSRLDRRFDLPALGPDTLRVAAEVGVAALACEAGRTVLLERDALVSLADAHGIALMGLSRPTSTEPAP
jgi:DUF1009 family protein